MEAREAAARPPLAAGANEWYLRIEGELMADLILNRIAPVPAT